VKDDLVEELIDVGKIYLGEKFLCDVGYNIRIRKVMDVGEEYSKGETAQEDFKAVGEILIMENVGDIFLLCPELHPTSKFRLCLSNFRLFEIILYPLFPCWSKHLVMSLRGSEITH
jgi:hypothetical protein